MQNRNKDLTEVFNQRWGANHNYKSIQNARMEQKNFTDKMFGNTNNKTNDKVVTNHIEEDLKRMKNNINSVRNSYINNNRK